MHAKTCQRQTDEGGFTRADDGAGQGEDRRVHCQTEGQRGEEEFSRSSRLIWDNLHCRKQQETRTPQGESRFRMSCISSS